MNAIQELEQVLRGWVRWYRLRQAVWWGARGLAAGLGVGLAGAVVIALRGRLVGEEFIALIAAAAGAGALLGVLAAWVWPFPMLEAARYFDRKFGLQERTSTALEVGALIGERQPGPAARPRPELLARQVADAARAARRVRPRDFLPLRIPWREAALVALLLIAALAFWQRADTFFQLALQLRQFQSTIDAQVEEIDALIEEIEQNPDLTAEQKEELVQPLEQAVQDLQQAETPEQAVSILNATEQELQQLSSQEALQQRQGLQQAGQELAQQGGPLEGFAQNLAEGDVIAAANDLQNLDVGSLSPEEQAALADQLAQAAEALAGSNPQLAEQLNQAAQALREGDTQAAQQALNQAAQTLTQAGQQIAQAEAAQQAAQQIAQGQQQVAQAAGQQGQGQQGQNGQGQQGQGEGQGQGAGQGQGQGQSQGQAQAGGEGGGGSGAGQGAGNTEGAGPQAGADPIPQNNAPGDGGEVPFEPLSAPQRIGGEEGVQVTIPGSGEPGDTVISEGPAAPGSPGQSSVPYQEVFPAYEQAARQAIESGQIPPTLRPLVREYFGALEP